MYYPYAGGAIYILVFVRYFALIRWIFKGKSYHPNLLYTGGLLGYNKNNLTK